MDESKVLNTNIGADSNGITEGAKIQLANKARNGNRKTGIDIIGDVPWGTHLCQFYKTKEDLLDILIPYFTTGLENNEFCMWVCWDPLRAEEARLALNKIPLNIDDYIKRGQIEIVDYSKPYTVQGDSGFDTMKQFWVEKEKLAFKRGFEGLRLAGNTYWLERNEWKDFVRYEEEVDGIIRGHKMLAICPYSLDKCGASEIIDVIGNHKSAIIRREGEWEIIESAERKKAEEEIKKAEEGFRALIQNSSDIMAILKGDMSIQYVSPAIERILDYRPEHFIGKKVLNYIHSEDLPVAQTKLTEIIKRPGVAIPNEFRVQHRNGSWIYVEVIANNLLKNPNVEAIVLNARDITERKSAEETLKKMAYDLRKRVKELNCLYALSMLVEKPGVSLEEILQGMADIMPPAWQYPDITRVRIVFEDVEYKTDKFKMSKWKQSSDIKVHGKKIGTVEVYCLEEKPETYEGPFLKAERALINAIAGRLGRIAERKKAEEMLRQSEAKFKTVFVGAPEGILVADLQTKKFRYANPAICRMFGYTEEEFLRRGVTDIHPKEFLNYVMAEFEAQVRGKKLLSSELPCLRKDGTLFYVNVSGVEMVLDGHKCNAGFFTDITEYKKMREEIKNLARFPSENPHPVLRMNSRKSILYKNSSVDALLKKMKLSEKDIFKILPGNLKAVIKKALKTKKTVYDLEVPAANKIFSYNIIPVVEAGYANLYGRDVTERKKAETEIKENERRFHDLAESLPQLVWTCFPDGRCDFLSRQWIEYTGIPEARQLGFGWLKQLHPDDRKPTVRAWNKTVKKDARFDVEFRICRRDGVYRWFKTRAVAMRDANGKVIRWFGSNTDIDDLKKAERKIKGEKKKTEKVFAELEITHKKLKKIQKQILGRERIMTTGALAAGVAHEVRNPLAIIGMTVQYLQSKLKENDPKRELTEAIIKKVERLDRVTRELSSYGRTMDLNIRKHKLARCLNMNLALIKPKCRVQKVKIKKRYSRIPLVEIDDDQMDKVFLNIMDNAIQAMPHGGILTVSTEFDGKANMVIIKIHNTGSAIKKKHLPHIFKPFYTSRKGKGTGLGLAIVHNVIIRHNGQIAVLNRSSGKDKGVAFIISLPISPPPSKLGTDR